MPCQGNSFSGKRKAESRHPLHHPKGNHEYQGNDKDRNSLAFMGWFIGIGFLSILIYWLM